MNPAFDPNIAALAGAGLVGGLGLLVRGFGSYRTGIRIADTPPRRSALSRSARSGCPGSSSQPS